jgi:hypothetical protein
MECTEILLQNQPAKPENLQLIEGFRCLVLGSDGLSGDYRDDEQTLVFVEDRDQFCRTGRDRRFPFARQAEILCVASGVAIILYEPRVRRRTRRLGQGKQDLAHAAALADLLGRFTVVVKTTSDRASYWQSMALSFVPRGSPVVTFGGCGAVLVTVLEGAA